MSLRGIPRFTPTTYHWGPSIHRQNDLGQILSLFDDLTGGEVSRRQSNSKQDTDRFFAPRFDLFEAEDHYQLEGELPGIKQEDISIEFTDEQTLVVSGKSEVYHEEGTRPKDSSHKARVEDESEGAGAGGQSTEVVKSSSGDKQEKERTYWVSERRSGLFNRSFSFPASVKRDAVKASLKNGILTLTIPKAPASSHKVTIQ